MGIRFYDSSSLSLTRQLGNPSFITPIDLHFDGVHHWMVDSTSLHGTRFVGTGFVQVKRNITLTLPDAISNPIQGITGNGKDLFVAYNTVKGGVGGATFAQIDHNGNVIKDFRSMIEPGNTTGGVYIECVGSDVLFSYTLQLGPPINTLGS